MTKAQIIRKLKDIGLKPQIAAGQNFLLMDSIVERMVKAAEVTAKDTVIEIGPGLGILTQALLKTGAKVIAVELDQRLFGFLGRQFIGEKNLQLIHSDIFRLNLNEYVKDGQYKVVANLPYSSTSLVFRNFLSLSPRPSRLTVMVQQEVGKRITAEPGKMSLLSCMVQYYSQARYLWPIVRSNFYPQPNVDSAVVDCQLKAWPDPKRTKKFFQVARAGFSSRRKQLRNALAAGLHIEPPAAEKLLAGCGVDETRRAQDLELGEWLKLAEKIN